ncbi:hypothetical protein Plhal304r1_c056g0142341 [Plasmopara halstedii]
MTHFYVSLETIYHIVSTRRRFCRLGTCFFLFIVIVVDILSVDTAASTIGTLPPPHCVRCMGLKHCTIMNGQFMFDPIAGYSRVPSTQLEKQGVCEDLDAKTLALSAFGPRAQYKDTSLCHKLVWNFHCLSWVTTSFKRSVNGTFVNCGTKNGSSNIPLPPCRSLCVEVADKCVYSHFYRMYLDEVCGNIGCLTEIQEARISGAHGINVAETTCVSGTWVYNESKTYSRCSTRSFETPAATAAYEVVNNGVACLYLLLQGCCLLDCEVSDFALQTCEEQCDVIQTTEDIDLCTCFVYSKRSMEKMLLCATSCARVRKALPVDSSGFSNPLDNISRTWHFAGVEKIFAEAFARESRLLCAEHRKAFSQSLHSHV